MKTDNLLMSFLLADIKEKQLKKSGIDVPANFKSRALLFSSFSQNPLMGFVLLDNESKKLQAKGILKPELAKELATGENDENLKIEGKVIDGNGDPKKDITVFIKGAGDVARSDSHGKFNISVPKTGGFTLYYDVESSKLEKDIRKKVYSKAPTGGRFGDFELLLE